MRQVRLTRAEQQAQTRERLLAAAEKVFARHGYGGASIDLISAEAGYSKGAIYSNFESKDAVFLELMLVYMDRGMTELEQVVAAGSDPASALGQWLQTMHVDNDCLMLVTELQLQARRNPSFAKAYSSAQARQTKALAGLLDRILEGHRAAAPCDTVDLADACLAIAHGMSLQRPLDTHSGVVGKIIDGVIKGLVARPAQPKPRGTARRARG